VVCTPPSFYATFATERGAWPGVLFDRWAPFECDNRDQGMPRALGRCDVVHQSSSDVVYRTVIVSVFCSACPKERPHCDRFELLNVKVNTVFASAPGDTLKICRVRFYPGFGVFCILHCAFYVCAPLRWPNHSNTWQGIAHCRSPAAAG
jgi:hypothetical protein